MFYEITDYLLIFTPTMDTAEKENLIRAGKKKKTVSGFKEKQNITITDECGKVIAVQKEKKVEEAGVTKQKRNFMEFESKLGTERNTDIRKIKGPTLRAVEPRVEEKIIMKKKKKTNIWITSNNIHFKFINKKK